MKLYVDNHYGDTIDSTGRRRASGGESGGQGSGTDTTTVGDTPTNQDPVTSILPWPPAREMTAQQRSRSFTIRAPSVPLPAVWGPARTGGIIVFEKLVNGQMIVNYEVCHGPINSMTVTIDGQDPTLLGASVESYLGSRSQAVSPILAAADARQTSGKPGIAHYVVKFAVPAPGAAIPNYEAFQATIQGLLVRDPRSDATLVTRAYSDNPSLIWADVKTSRRYGEGVSDADVNWTAVGTAATDCDFNIGGGVKRYTMSYRIDGTSSVNPEQVYEDIRSHALLNQTFNSGLWTIWVDKAQAASGVSFTDTGVSEQIIDAWFREKGRSECPTRIRVNYSDVAAGYKDQPAEDADPNIAGNTVEDILYEYNLPGVPTYDQAKRLSIQYRNRAALNKQYFLIVGPNGTQVLPGSVISVTSAQINVSSVLMIVTDVSNSGTSAWQLTCELYDATVYNDTPVTGPISAFNTVPSRFDEPPEAVLPHAHAPGSDGVGYADWSAPSLYSTTLYPGASWTSSGGWSSFTAANINDGNTALAALGMNNTTTSSAVVDLGSAKAIRVVDFWTSAALDSTGFGSLIISYSDTGTAGPWTDVSSGNVTQWNFETTTTRFRVPISAVGSHRYWRFQRLTSGSSVATTATINELWFRELGDIYPYVKEYRVYSFTRDAITQRYTGRTLQYVVPAKALPTATQPLAVTAPIAGYTKGTPPGYTNFGDATQYLVTVVSTGDNESFGVAAQQFLFGAAANGGGDTWVNQSEQTLAMPAGAGPFNDVIINPGPGMQVVTATVGFQINGLTPLGTAGGQRVTLYNNTAFNMTLGHLQAGSAAANRINCRNGGANLGIGPGGTVELIYVNAITTWIVMGFS